MSDYIEKTKYDQLALDLWDYAEMGYLETKSSKAMKDILIDEGFSIKDGVASIPTAFIAEYNNGGPIIGVLQNLMHYQAYLRAQTLTEILLVEMLDTHVGITYLELLLFMQR